MKLLNKKLSRILGFWLIGIVLLNAAGASEDRIKTELASPESTIPLKNALGDKVYSDAMASGKYHYVGNTKCRLCHRKFFLGRKKDHHDFSMEHLTKSNHQEAGNCLVCHSTGFGVPTGFVGIKETPRLANVQCEGCHGPGNVHIDMAKQSMRARKKERVYGFLAGSDNPDRLKKMCMSCHNERWNRSFSDLEAAYDKYRKAVPK